MQAVAARDRVRVKYVNVRKPILTLEEAIEQESFYPKMDSFNHKCGDPEGKLFCDQKTFLCLPCKQSN